MRALAEHPGRLYGSVEVDPNRGIEAVRELETPVVSAVSGTIAGARWMLGLLADLVVAGQGARWVHAFARRGMVPHAGDPFFLPRVPFHKLNEGPHR